ncbi:MAG: trypsin-like peptidase domain-containing protein [Candidatus Bathyarchaeia archaeon]|nr:trypsin-like peptidase domain-containing protein [Candidatus Bathyarchaeia archaeon]
MEETSGIAVDKKFLLAMILVCLALSGGFAFIYLDLKADFTALKDDYANLSAQIEQLQGLIETLHHDQIINLTAVQIYNRTKHSVVLITTGDKAGSGFVYSAAEEGGYIVTNSHVVDGGSAEITVTFLDGTVAQAKFIGGDVYSDLAVIKVEELPEQAHPLILGNSSQLMVGEPVYAIGNPFGLSGSMTAGIISQVGRVLSLGELGVPEPWGNYVIADVIQFDAAVNPGNSGGPLLNSLGLVVGVTFAIETAKGVRAFIGIGYAVPSDLVRRVVPSIIETGHYYHPWVGIEYNSSYTGGMLVVSVISGSPAEKAGLQKNDIIIKVDGRPVNRGEDLIIYLERYKSPGDTIILIVVRNKNVLDEPIKLTLGKRPT